MMFSAFQTFGKLGAMASSVARAWSPLALWPDGIATPGMWISPRDLTSQWQDYAGTTPVATPGSVADSANPVGLALDIRAGATALAHPGNHMFQATAAARPLESARVNLLTNSEQITTSPWAYYNGGNGSALSPITSPDGTVSAIGLNDTSGAGYYGVTQNPNISAGVTSTFSCYVKQGTNITGFSVWLIGSGSNTFFQGTIAWTGGVPTASGWVATSVGNGWYRISYAFSANASTSVAVYLLPCPTATAETGSTYFWGAQLNLGILAPYQRIGAVSDYNATGITPFQLYDGIDDSQATTSFAAGTLINGMDCMIAVMRYSGANCVAGLYNGIADATKFFGMAEPASGSGCVGSGAGTPTVWVDNAQLTGGTAVTRGTLHTALTVGDYHILEFRGLDLSTWTAAGFGLYTSYVFPGARGDIMLFESTASTEDKDAARQWLADYYGVTLP